MTDPFSGAVDLGAIARQQQANVFECDVPDGCGYKVRNKKHESLKDCVTTSVMYAEQLIQETTAVLDQVAMVQPLSDRVNQLTSQVSTLISANQRFQNDLNDREAKIEEYKRLVGKVITPEASEGSHGTPSAA